MERLSKYRCSRYVTLIRSLMLSAMLLPASVSANFTLRMQTDLGALDIELFDSVAPISVANYMSYVNSGAYEDTFIHISRPGIGLQGGGFRFDPADNSLLLDGATHIPATVPLASGFTQSNLRGTLASAVATADPDSISEWFFNTGDNSANFDSQGITVFGRVLGNGMDVIDEINSLLICGQLGLPFCGQWLETPFADPINFPDNEDNLILVSKIGTDGEGDGAIDDLENGAPNAGDGNNDGTLDSLQQHVASAPAGNSGQYILVESPSAVNPLQSFNAMGLTFLYANPPTPVSLFTGVTFNQGYVGYDVLNVVPGGDIIVKLTLPVGETPDTFYNYGPTPQNPAPHWYEFLFDGVTGAEFNNNIVTLHFRDGERGDADGDNSNGIIMASPGGPTNRAPDQDGDGVPDAIEDAHPNNGDGNGDGTADSQQPDVASFEDSTRGDYITLEVISSALSPAPELRSVLPQVGQNFLQTANPPSLLNGLNFIHGFVGFRIVNVAQGDSIDVRMILPAGEQPITYFQYGATPADTSSHLYKFLFDTATGTGAEFNGNVVTLHFVDGDRGDSDLAANGVIVDLGAPALAANNPAADASSGGGGCTLTRQAPSAWRAGGWWLLFSLLIGYRMLAGFRRGRTEPNSQRAPRYSGNLKLK